MGIFNQGNNDTRPAKEASMHAEDRFEDLHPMHADGDAPGVNPAGWGRRNWVMRSLQGVHRLSAFDDPAPEPIPFDD